MTILAPPLKLRRVQAQRLRELGLDEGWLQQQIASEPSLLGLGELQVIQREKRQPQGGRIDFLMYDAESEIRFEIELMLGAVDESHIIRTIEYWDIERQRYPMLEHRAVIVAEEITARFFNVIRLLNRAVPLMAIQLSAFRFNEEVVLQFTRVLDTYEFGAESDDDVPLEPADRAYWEKKADAESLAVVDAVTSLVPTDNGSPRVTYNRSHIAIATTGYNFCWFHPRRSFCVVHIKVGADRRAEIIERLEEEDIAASNRGRSEIRLRLRVEEVRNHSSAFAEVMRVAEAWSHR